MGWLGSRMAEARRYPLTPWAAVLICVACFSGSAQTGQVTCDRGYGHFEARFPTGVTVRVAPVRSEGFATRACEAVLSSGSDRVVVVRSAAQVDIDVLGADLGFGVPVVAFVVWPAQKDSRPSYEIWSLGKKPRLLRTLVGGDSYRAVDADFNRRVAIWTTDATAAANFDGLSFADFTFPPTVVLRLERGRVVDVSAWYRAQYDREIAALRNQLTPAALVEFRSSDGQLKFGSVPAVKWVALRKTKAAVLEIVWAYLYSGRPELARAELDSVWPSGDVARVKAAVAAAYSGGVRAQVQEVAPATRPLKWMEKPFLYEYLQPVGSKGETSGRLMYGVPGVSGSEGPVLVRDEVSSSELREADTEPQAISLWRPPPSAAEQQMAYEEETVSLTIDEAGKVESAKMVAPRSDPELLRAAKEWKFIPASRDGKPVAYQLTMDVQPLL